MITRAHILAWTIAALSGGVIACETAPAKAGTPRTLPDDVWHFRHNGNDCYVYERYAAKVATMACVPAIGYGR